MPAKNRSAPTFSARIASTRSRSTRLRRLGFPIPTPAIVALGLSSPASMPSSVTLSRSEKSPRRSPPVAWMISSHPVGPRSVTQKRRDKWLRVWNTRGCNSSWKRRFSFRNSSAPSILLELLASREGQSSD
ncbi:uncharacterized protein LOC109792701 isoform X1 [Cajanus cajan]|uniref:uncharacterized protein LOC109792701 isoform X1 n=1 Tax=Cajanus cajan TaxID=3821 RepID=UPI0010FBB44E|nr:uncharacterized protein LOC109792701 isoform X1 [Cajanus cajan]